MVYDSSRQVTVLFGGFVGGTGGLADTWEYDGTTWTQRTPATVPPSRYEHAMVYDSTRQVTVLFGGWRLNANVADTWEYDGTTWTQRTPSAAPSRRNAHAMAYDSTRQVTVLFGGQDGTDDTWLWDGTSWSAPVQVQNAPVIDMSTRPNGIWHYTTIDVPAGVQVNFRNNDANTPVVWLATGLVRIAGEINLDGGTAPGNADPGNEAPGGPGGFAGGLGGQQATFNGSYAGTPGEGPGGGLPGITQSESGGSGGYATPGSGSLGGPTYGNSLIRPLVGSSGGGGGAAPANSDGGNGGGGGGAILIASSDTIQLNGSIHANGGSGTCRTSCGGYGSGGSIRLLANRIEGNDSLSAISGGQGQGRIRLEAFFVQSSLSRSPAHTFGPPLTVGLDDSLGIIRITDIAGQVVPNAPTGDTNTPDVIFTAAGPVTITLATTQIPTGTPLTVRITASGQVITVQSTPTNASGVATATADVPAGVGTIQAFATYIPQS